MNNACDSFWIKPVISKESAYKLALKKTKEASMAPELIYIPYRLYTYHISMKRLGLSPRTLQIQVVVNEVTSNCCSVFLDHNHLIPGAPDQPVFSQKFGNDHLESLAYKEAFFSISKRYYLLFEPQITCIKTEEIFCPFWHCGSDFYLDARKGETEKIPQ